MTAMKASKLVKFGTTKVATKIQGGRKMPHRIFFPEALGAEAA